MEWDRYVEFVINLAAKGTDTLVRSISSLTTAKADIVQNDEFPVRLRFALPTNVSTSPLEVVRLAPGSVIVFTGKDAANLSAGDLLYYLDEFEEGLDESGYFYTGILNTNTDEALAAFTGLGSKSSLAVTNEVEIQNAGNTQRTSFQHSSIFRRQVYNGEAAPTPAPPPYPVPSALLIVSAGDRRYLRPLLTLDALAGGTENALDAIPTLAAVAPFVVLTRIGDVTRMHLYRAGTDAEAAPGIVRPDDFDPATHAFIYEQIL